MERGTVRVTCPAQKLTTMSRARAQTQTARSGDKCINYEAITTPMRMYAKAQIQWDFCAVNPLPPSSLQKYPVFLNFMLFLMSYITHKRQCFIGISKQREESSRTCNAHRSIFQFRGVWIVDETLSWVFDICFQSEQKLRSKQRSKIFKIHSN